MITENIEALAASQVPAQIRSLEPALRFQPVFRIRWGIFFLLIGDHSIGISVSTPYPGWSSLRDAVERVLFIVNEKTKIAVLDRYSIKYVDLIEKNGELNDVEILDLELRFGRAKLADNFFRLRIEEVVDNVTHIRSVARGSISIDSRPARSGLLLETDSVMEGVIRTSELDRSRLDNLHQANKIAFFDSLTQNGLRSLEPHYD